MLSGRFPQLARRLPALAMMQARKCEGGRERERWETEDNLSVGKAVIVVGRRRRRGSEERRGDDRTKNELQTSSARIPIYALAPSARSILPLIEGPSRDRNWQITV